jgi:hypothetical protein
MPQLGSIFDLAAAGSITQRPIGGSRLERLLSQTLSVALVEAREEIS